MKKLLTLFMFLCSICAFAQDIIVKKDGATVVCRVVELNASEIIYKKWNDLNGSNYVMNRSDASAIKYQSGKTVGLGEAENLYAPNNQNDGSQRFNDIALLRIDAEKNGTPAKARKLRQTAFIGGGILLGAGAICLIADGAATSTPYFIVGVTCLAGAVIWTTGFYIASNNIIRQSKRLQASSLYQQDFNFKNGTTLSPSIDLLKDQALNQQTIGIGLHYNF